MRMRMGGGICQGRAFLVSNRCIPRLKTGDACFLQRPACDMYGYGSGSGSGSSWSGERNITANQWTLLSGVCGLRWCSIQSHTWGGHAWRVLYRAWYLYEYDPHLLAKAWVPLLRQRH